MEILFVDRIDGKHIVCENAGGEEIILNVQNVRCKVKEGDVVYTNDSGEVIVDKELTHKRKQEILKLRDSLTKPFI